MLLMLQTSVTSVILVMNMTNPFKPGSGLYPPYFAGREREIDLFSKKLDHTINGTPMHMAIIGDWATGKTSLQRKFRDVSEKRECFVTEIISPATDSISVFVQTVLNTIQDDLRRRDGTRFFKTIKGKLESVEGIGISAFGFGATVQQSKSKISSPQFDLSIGIRAIWETISTKYKSMVLLIDDFDLVSNDAGVMKEVMLTLRNSLMKAVNDGVKATCVVSGVTLFKQVETIHGPLVRFFEPFELGNLDRDSAKYAITKPLGKMGVIFSDDVVERILDITEGHPYYVQEFCYVLYENKIKNRIDIDIFETSYPKILHDLARKMWRQRLAELGDVSIKILYLIAKGNKTTDVINTKGSELFEINPTNIRVTLTRLQKGGYISRVSRGEYELSDKLFGEYLITLFPDLR